MVVDVPGHKVLYLLNNSSLMTTNPSSSEKLVRICHPIPDISERLLSRDYPEKAIKIQNHYPASKFQSEAPHPRAEYCRLDLICILPALMVILRGTPSHKHKISLTITYQRLYYWKICLFIIEFPNYTLEKSHFTKNCVKLFFRENMHLNYITLKHYFSFSSIYASSLYVWMVIIFHLVFFLFSW